MTKRGQHKATPKGRRNTAPAEKGRTFPTGAILSVVTGRSFCSAAEVVELLEYLLAKELATIADWKAAAEWITAQLQWTAKAAESLKRHKSKPETWLAGQIKKHGEHHHLLPMHGGECVPHEVDPWDDDWIAMEIDDGLNKLNGPEGNVIETEDTARLAVDRLCVLAMQGDAYALHALNNLAVGMAKGLASLRKQSLFAETPVVMPADLAARRKATERAGKLRIGTSVGFPAPKNNPGKKTGRPTKSTDGTPASFWRDVAFRIDVARNLLAMGEKIDDWEPKLIARIAALPDFGSGARDEWLAVGYDLVTGNINEAVPGWLVKRCNKQSGMPALAKRTLKKGFDSCWPV